MAKKAASPSIPTVPETAQAQPEQQKVQYFAINANQLKAVQDYFLDNATTRVAGPYLTMLSQLPTINVKE